MTTRGQMIEARTQSASVGYVYLPATAIECVKQGHTLFARRPSNLDWTRPGP